MPLVGKARGPEALKAETRPCYLACFSGPPSWMRKKSFAVPSSVAQEAHQPEDSVPSSSESRPLIVQCRIEYICHMLMHSKLSSRQTLVPIHDIGKAKLGESHCRDKNGRNAPSAMPGCPIRDHGQQQYVSRYGKSISECVDDRTHEHAPSTAVSKSQQVKSKVRLPVPQQVSQSYGAL